MATYTLRDKTHAVLTETDRQTETETDRRTEADRRTDRGREIVYYSSTVTK